MHLEYILKLGKSLLLKKNSISSFLYFFMMIYIQINL